MNQTISAGTTEPVPTLLPQDNKAHSIEFTGSGGEYFKVWIVNVLLSIVTLGIYTPWARRRTAQYFYSHTLVAGSPLEFTAPLRKMVMGFVIVTILVIAYNVATNTVQGKALIWLLTTVVVLVALLTPFIWASAMRFRLRATRWRGLRLQFTAHLKEAYIASWPIFAMALMWFGVAFGMQMLWPDMAQHLEAADESSISDFAQTMDSFWDWGKLILVLVLSMLCFIRLEYNFKSLLVRKARLGAEKGCWKPVYMDFVKIWLATVAVFILCVLSIYVLVSALAGGLLTSRVLDLGTTIGLILLIKGIIVLVIFLGLILALTPARAYREARMFQLMWNNIGVSHVAHFKCRLKSSSFLGLRIKNALLTTLTLGLYRPFARVSEYRMKADSVTLHVKGDIEQVTGTMVRQQQGGLGDALADAAGLDLIG